MKIIELSDRELTYLIAVAKTAQANGQTLKVCVDGGLKIKRGESMWTAPMGHDLNK
jgi:hypothetical protein